ncbi:8-oxoguanine DNA glycosylase OGG fold protein [Micromonospora sp. H33]|uniref:8-oxoguanine DNA glycosylase OGG fold protein n=1 Tax=Micromonospora sp. H33 TaxID=3452215 RepID=UPI003F8970A8
MTDLSTHALPGELAAVTVHIDRWRAALPPDAWPGRFPETGVVWRRDVFAVADAWRAGEATPRQLLSAVLMWGYGPIGYGPWRTARSLEGDPDGTRHALDGLRAPILDEDVLRTAYRRLRDPKESRLPRLGPAFFTKLLYFAGYRRGAGGLQPLILDSVVARRLPAGSGVSRPSAWLTEEWLSYLSWAAGQAHRRGIEPEEVEMALFHDRWEPGSGTP